MIVEFDGEVFLWDARREEMFLAALPDELSADIRDLPRPTRGFGSVRVEATIGSSRWRTSIFPDSGRRSFVLPLKKSVRDAEGIENGAVVRISLHILDV